MLRDGIEDYEYFAILKRLLEDRGNRLSADQRSDYAALLDVPAHVTGNMTTFTKDPAAIGEHRDRIARAIMGCLASPVSLADGPTGLAGRDPYGGWNSLRFEPTGFFHVSLRDGVWWLVTPGGNAFLSKGVNNVSFRADDAPKLGYSPYQRGAERVRFAGCLGRSCSRSASTVRTRTTAWSR